MTRMNWGGMAAIVAIGVAAVAPQGASYGSAKGASQCPALAGPKK